MYHHFLSDGSGYVGLGGYGPAWEVVIEYFFGSSQGNAINERQCCEHALVQEGYPKVEVLLGKPGYEHAWESDEHQQEHTEGKASLHGTGKMLADFGRTAEEENAERVDKSRDDP